MLMTRSMNRRGTRFKMALHSGQMGPAVRACGESGAATLVTLRLPSDVNCIEEAVELVTRHCLAGHDATQTTRFRLRVVLSEALSNAIVQGNREDRTKWVDVRAELVPDAIRVSVTDEGAGFDPDSVPEPIKPELPPGGLAAPAAGLQRQA